MINTILITSFVVLRILSNPLGNVFQKQLTANGNHPLLVNFLTYLLLSLLCVLLYWALPSQSFSFDFWLYAFLGGIVGATGNAFLVKALAKGELSVMGPINAYKSLIGMLVAVLLLGEIPNIWGILGVGVIIYGSYFVLDSKDEPFSWALLKNPAIQFRIWGMILTAIEAVFVKKVILASSTAYAFICWSVFGAFFAFLLLQFYSISIKHECKKIASADISKYLLLVLCVGTMQFTTNYTFEHIHVAYALSLFQLSSIVSVLLGYRIFQEKEIYRKLIGAVLMMIGSVIIILLK